MPKKNKTSARIKVKRPPQEMLVLYYSMWLAGANNEALISGLGITKKYLKANEPSFHEYCRQKAAHETRRKLTNDGAPSSVAITEDRREKLIELVGNGASIQTAANLLGIPLLTITELWYKEDETLKATLEYARDQHNYEVIAAARKRAVGYEYDYIEEHDESGETPQGFISKVKTVKKKIHVPGSTTAQKLWLAHHLGWSDMPQGSSEDSSEVEYDIREQLYEEEDNGDND